MPKRICLILLALCIAFGMLAACAPESTPDEQTIANATMYPNYSDSVSNITEASADESDLKEIPTENSADISNEPMTAETESIKEPAPQSSEPQAEDPKTTPAPAESQELKLGDTGDAVEKVQERLIKLGYMNGPADGKYGKNTENAIGSFQRQNELPVTGRVDLDTRNVLFSKDAISISRPLAGYVIGLDPGHQLHSNRELEPEAPGSDVMKKKVSSGTEGSFTHVPEYQVNLDVALMLRDLLVREGATVVMTRETNDVNISNIERAQFFNRKKTDYALRLHCNGTDDANRKGAFMLVPKKNPYLDECNLAAEILIDEYCKATGANNLGITIRSDQTGFNWCERMIINIEMGHMSNKEEDYNLTNPEYQKKMARGLLNGILKYFDRVG